MSSPKRTVQLLLIDGNAGGRIQAKLDNWTGVVYKMPKVHLSQSKEREDLAFCGVYVLFGRDEESNETLAYIGQASGRKSGQSVLERVAEHSRSEKRRFFNEVVFFTNTTDDFGPTELCYLEHEFWKLARDAQRCELQNGNEPSSGNVTEAKQAELDRYVENAKILIRTLGYLIFEPKAAQNTDARQVFYLHRKCRDGTQLQASMQWTGEGLVVLKGSRISSQEGRGLPPFVSKLRKRLFGAGKLTQANEATWTLQEDQIFSSPSAAGCFVTGRSCNGRTAWKTAQNQTFDQVEKNFEH